MTYYSYIPIVCIAIIVGTLMAGGWHFRSQAPLSDKLGPNQALIPTGPEIADPGVPTITPIITQVPPSPLPLAPGNPFATTAPEPTR